jgi:hypothetical protein
MLDLTQLNQIDLNSNKTLSEMKEKVADIVMHNYSKEARILVKFLEEQLAKNKNLNYRAEYEKIISQLKFIYLYTLSDNEIISLYQHDFGKILEYYEFYEPFGLLRIALLSKLLEERDPFKRRIILALASNKELITKQALFFTRGGPSEAPSIGNWLKDYAKTVGGGNFSNLAKANYFTKSENYRRLSEEEKNKVKTLFKFYFRLQLSSMTPEGFESDIIFTDKDGKTKILSEGKIIDTSKVVLPKVAPAPPSFSKVKEVDEEEEFNQQTEELINILEEEFMQDTGGDFDKLVLELKQNIEIGAEEEVMAILRILEKQGKIGELQKDREVVDGLNEMGVPMPRQSKQAKTPQPRNIAGQRDVSPLIRGARGVNTPQAAKTKDGIKPPVPVEIPATPTIQPKRKVVPVPAPASKPAKKKVAPVPQPAQKQVATAPKTIKQLMQEVLLGTPEEAEKISRFEARIGSAEGNEIEKIITGLQQSIKTKKTTEVIARLRLLAKLDPQRLINLLQPGSPEDIPSFQNLIKNILSGMLGLPEFDAARYGMQLAMILKKQGQANFMKAVYFDKKEKVFKWNKV